MDEGRTIREHKDSMAQVDEAARRDRHRLYEESKPRWLNAFGEEVDLDDIDREYALNILMMYHACCVRRDYTVEDIKTDPLMQKLREVVLTGREPNGRDRVRGLIYSARCKIAGKPFRAPVKDVAVRKRFKDARTRD